MDDLFGGLFENIDWTDVGLTAGGSVVSALADREALKKKQRLADALAQMQRAKAGETMAASQKFIGTLAPERRMAALDQGKNELGARLNEGIGAARAFEAPENFAGKVSDDYRRVRGDAGARADERLQRAVSQLSSIGGADIAALSRNLQFNESGRDINATKGEMDNIGGAYTGAISGVRPDPFLSIAGQLMRGAGLAGMTKKRRAARF